MTLKHIQALAEALRSLGYEPDVREDYSGRGMYGRTTPAIVLRDGPLLAAAAARAVLDGVDDPDEFVSSLLDLRSDSMGRDDRVYY